MYIEIGEIEPRSVYVTQGATRRSIYMYSRDLSPPIFGGFILIMGAVYALQIGIFPHDM